MNEKCERSGPSDNLGQNACTAMLCLCCAYAVPMLSQCYALWTHSSYRYRLVVTALNNGCAGGIVLAYFDWCILLLCWLAYYTLLCSLAYFGRYAGLPILLGTVTP